jgi:hypothetical protein
MKPAFFKPSNPERKEKVKGKLREKVRKLAEKFMFRK